METKKFWCHYIGKDGNTPKRRSIELTKFDGIIAFDNNHVKTPLWCEIYDDDYQEGKKCYRLYAQISDNVAVYTRNIVSDVHQVDNAKRTDKDFDELCESRYQKWINPNMSEEARKRERENAIAMTDRQREDKTRFFGVLTILTDYTNYLLSMAKWITCSEIKAYEEVKSPYLSGLKELREKFMAERKAKEEERRKKAEEARKAEEEKQRQEAIAEEERLTQEEQKFVEGKDIDGYDLAELCKRHGIKLHLRTIHNLKEVVTDINKTGALSYRKARGKRTPSFDGCYKAAYDLYKLLTNNK